MKGLKAIRKKLTFTKKLIVALVVICMVDLQVIIFLPVFGVPIQENIGVAIVSGIMATSIGYLLKSYKETKEEERIKLEREKMNRESKLWENTEENYEGTN